MNEQIYPVSSQISTPIRYGGFWIRLIAVIIDAIVITLFTILLATVFNFISNGIWGLLSMIIVWLYAVLLESSALQATLGKKAAGLRVTDVNGNRISFLRATGRHFAKLISGMILFIGFLMIAFTQKKQGLHDIIAGTVVVRTENSKRNILITLVLFTLLIIGMVAGGSYLLSKLGTFLGEISKGITSVAPNEDGSFKVNIGDTGDISSTALNNRGAWQCINQRITISQPYIHADSSYQMASDSKGNLYYVDNQKDKFGISKIDANGKTIELWSKTPSFMRSVAINSKDNIYGLGLCDSNNSTQICLIVFAENGQSQKIPIEAKDKLADSLFIGPNDSLFVIDNDYENVKEYGVNYNDVIEINVGGKVINRHRKVGQGVEYLVFDNKGTIYTLNRGDTNYGYPSISKISNGQVSKEWVKLDRAGLTIDIDSNGNLYTAYGRTELTQYPQYEIIKITPENQIIKKDLKNPFPGDVKGIHVDSGNIYVQFLTSANLRRESIPDNPAWSYILRFDSDLNEQGIAWSAPDGRYAQPFHLFKKANNQHIVFAGLNIAEGYGDDVKYYISQCR